MPPPPPEMKRHRKEESNNALLEEGGGGGGGGGGGVREVKGGRKSWCVVELPLGEAAVTFDLERAVCSHGLFMMAPNHWDPFTKTLLRPLRLFLSPSYAADGDDDDADDSSSTSLLVGISHPPHNLHSLRICVYGTHFLSPKHQRALLAQVSRMLHLSEMDERNVREFQKKMQGEITKEERSFSGRVFRSPTLFEDMVKCILLCNCQWPRTLSMARALCELQLELQSHSCSLSVADADSPNSTCPKAESESFIPKTPVGNESKRKMEVCKISKKLTSKFANTKAELEAYANLKMHQAEMTDSLEWTEKLDSGFHSSEKEDDSHERCSRCPSSIEVCKVDSCLFSDRQSTEGKELCFLNRIGNFPGPKELASLDESFLAKRCNLGYRASRILKLAQSVVDGRILLRQIEEACSGASPSNYNELARQLKQIDGFGPFTCANVLVCLGFYHVIPTDSETIRHLKQVHARKSTVQTVQRDVEDIYGKYAPFQFLAYWSELWHFYEKRFGKLNEIPHSDYKLITASNMKINGGGKYKRTKITR